MSAVDNTKVYDFCVHNASIPRLLGVIAHSKCALLKLLRLESASSQKLYLECCVLEKTTENTASIVPCNGIL